MKQLSFIIIVSLTSMVSLACEENEPDDLPQLIGSFNDDNRIEITQRAGETIILAYNGDLIFVEIRYDYAASCYRPTFIEIDSTFIVNEEYFDDDCEGSSEFLFRVPTPFDIIFNGISSDLSVLWGSGYYDFTSISGSFTADSLAGSFDVSTTSGNIQLNDVVIENQSFLTSHSGNVEVSLAESPGGSINMSGSSGGIILNYDGNTVEGYFEFTARKDLGSISSPYPFDLEEEFTENSIVYRKKSFNRSGETPRIILATDSGSVKLLLN